jgi:uncharacterized protein
MDGKHLPRQHSIDELGGGGFRFGGMSHRGSLLVIPSGMRALTPGTIEALTADDLADLAAERDAIDFVLVGTGAKMQRLPKSLTEWLDRMAAHHDAMSTSAAVSTYNVLLAEGRRVAAILIAVG